MPADALTIATVETGVALRVFDTSRVRGELCIRDSAPGEALPGRPTKLAQGTLTIADGRGPLELLFGGTLADPELGSDAVEIAIVAVQVKGVPQAAVDEALWIAGAAIAA
jgi:phenylalanyl-tRNA synthetase beta subunit